MTDALPHIGAWPFEPQIKRLEKGNTHIDSSEKNNMYDDVHLMMRHRLSCSSLSVSMCDKIGLAHGLYVIQIIIHH